MGKGRNGEKYKGKNEWFWNKLYSLQPLNVRNVLVFNYMILVWLIILFSNKKNLKILQFGIILSNEAIMLESFIQFFGMTCIYFFKFLPVSKN